MCGTRCSRSNDSPVWNQCRTPRAKCIWPLDSGGHGECSDSGLQKDCQASSFAEKAERSLKERIGPAGNRANGGYFVRRSAVWEQRSHLNNSPPTRRTWKVPSETSQTWSG